MRLRFFGDEGLQLRSDACWTVEVKEESMMLIATKDGSLRFLPVEQTNWILQRRSAAARLEEGS